MYNLDSSILSKMFTKISQNVSLAGNLWPFFFFFSFGTFASTDTLVYMGKLKNNSVSF